MQGVGRGTVIAGRYTTHHRIGRLRSAERWAATDRDEDREVTVLVLESGAGESAAVLDAARRAAGIENARLVRVLDSGTWDGRTYVVEEGVPDAQTLAELVAEGGLPAEEVRRFSGEVATALEAAGQRGLHHLGLTPLSVLRRRDGGIRVRGLATEAAARGTDDVGGEEADRADAVGVVALTYAGLTGRWPLPGDTGDTGVDRVASVVGGVPSPSEIAAGVPGDLDTICRLTLNEDAGPVSPADFAAQVAPWSRTEVGGVSGAALSLDHAPTPGPLTGPGEDETQVVPLPEAAAEAGSARARVGAAGAAAAGVVAERLGSAAQAGGRVGDRVGGMARTTADRAAQRTADRRAQRDAEREAERARTVPLEETRFTEEVEEPPAPLLPASSGSAPGRTQGRIVLGVFAVFVLVAFGVGWHGVQQIGQGSSIEDVLGPESGRPSATPPVASTSSATGSPSSGTKKSSTSKDTGPVAILSATGYDPQGDGGEHDSEAPRVYDEDPSTYWSSEGYTSADFGGIKQGVGVVVDTGQEIRPSKVVLTLPNPEDVTVYLASNPETKGATKVGTSSGETGQVTYDVPGNAKGQYVIVWFTHVSQASDGRYRATLAEVSIDA